MPSVCEVQPLDLFLLDTPPPVPCHPINSLEQLISDILLDPNTGLFSKVNSSFSVLLLSRSVIGYTFSRGCCNWINWPQPAGFMVTGCLGAPSEGTLVVCILVWTRGQSSARPLKIAYVSMRQPWYLPPLWQERSTLIVMFFFLLLVPRSTSQMWLSHPQKSP